MVQRPADEVVPWLCEPALMARWMIGVMSVEAIAGADGDERAVRVRTAPGPRSADAFRGRQRRVGPERVERRYRLDADDPGAYERDVFYDLSPVLDDTAVSCTVVTTIPALGDAATRLGIRAEQESLVCSLDRLRAHVEQRRHASVARLRNGDQAPQPL